MIFEGVYRVAFAGLLFALLVMRVYFMIRVRRSGGRITPDDQAVAREGRISVILRAVLFIALLAFLTMYFLGAAWIDVFRFSLPGWLRWVGFALGVLAVAFWTWTQIHLDTQWSAQLQLKEKHHMVTTGPYTYIRHPLYLAMMIWGAAAALLTANWIFTAVTVLSIAGVVWRTPKEEQMMIETFGDVYRTYMQRTGRFFPKI
ncbi:MAG: isoprenylcysteine carboxylmethyltransferase family protein [Anaerolineaceae bacterium]